MAKVQKVTEGKSVNETKKTELEPKVSEVKKEEKEAPKVEVIRGNVEIVQLRLLEAINNNLTKIVDLLASKK